MKSAAPATIPYTLEYKLNRPKSSRKPNAYDTGVLWFGFSLLVFGVLAFGAVEPWACLVQEIGSVAIAVLWMMAQFRADRIAFRIGLSTLPAVGIAVVASLQLICRHTAYQYGTKVALVSYVSLLLIAVVIAQTFEFRSCSFRFLLACMFFGGTYSLFAIVQNFTADGKLYWFRVPRFGGWIFGSYVNHNHYAGLLEMLIPAAMVLAVSPAVRAVLRVAAGFSAAIMLMSVVLSGSRAGLMAALVGVAFTAVVVFGSRRGVRPILIAGAVILVFASLAYWYVDDATLSRIDTFRAVGSGTHHDPMHDMRILMYKDTWRMIKDRPFFGWGFGAYSSAFGQYQTFYIEKVVNEAHNDVLQALSDTGVVGFLLCCMFVYFLYRGSKKAMEDWDCDARAALRVAALSGTTALLFHSLFDFNLQLPANALWFLVLAFTGSVVPRENSAVNESTAASA